MSKKKKSTEEKPTNPNKRLDFAGFKLNMKERIEINKRAHKYTKGNTSKYLRLAALNYKPDSK